MIYWAGFRLFGQESIDRQSPDMAGMKKSNYPSDEPPWVGGSAKAEFAQNALQKMTAYKSTQQALRRQVQGILSTHGPVYTRFLQAQYDQTQIYLKQHGITEVTLYRGMILSPSRVRGLDDGGFVEAKLQPVSSFSTSITTAWEFAGTTDRGSGTVLAVNAPASRVLSTARTGFGALVEAEVTVLGGRYPAFVMNRKTTRGRGEFSTQFHRSLDRTRATVRQRGR